MKEENYKPYYLEDAKEIDTGHFVLSIRDDYNPDEDSYTEIHLKADIISSGYLNENIGSKIYINILSSTRFEFYTGEFYSECFVDEFPYSVIEWKKIAKTSRDWKSAFKQLEQSLKEKVKSAEIPYKITRRKVISNYQHIYNIHITNGITAGLNIEDIKRTSIFPLLFKAFTDNPEWDGIHHLINPNYGYYVTHKDWKDAYDETEMLLFNLSRSDVNDFNLIKEQMINRYTKMFYYMLPNLKYNYKNINEEQFISFFNLLMEKLKESY
ncbi:hypothetical protein ACLI1A_07075 [Flavobacterium sp. RHBU_3]|uniref:hypothetical protein n=1 Tax=Flavobacterium sp. RHBU_3 TaxID=3391184 RepID=UPI003984B7DA